MSICGNENCSGLVKKIADALNSDFVIYSFYLDNSKHYHLKFPGKSKLKNFIVVLNAASTNDQILELMLVKQFRKQSNMYGLLSCPGYDDIYTSLDNLIILNPYRKNNYQGKCLTFDTYYAFIYYINIIKKKLDKVSFVFIDNSDFSYFISNKYCYEQLFYINNCDYSKLSKNILIIGNCHNDNLTQCVKSKLNDHNLYIFLINIFDSLDFLKYNCVKGLYVSNYINYVCNNDIYSINKIHKIDITQYIINFLKAL